MTPMPLPKALAFIVLFHVFLEPTPDGLFVPILSIALGVFLAGAYWSSFAGVLNGAAQPD